MEHIVYLLAQYKYMLLFPLAILEGPIIAVVAGFLCINGFLNLFIVYPIIVAGDLIGDTICYFLGLWGVPGFIKKIAGWLGLNARTVDRARTYFNMNPFRTISLSKISPGVGVAGIYIAGNSRVPYRKFIAICLVTSLAQYCIYLGIGILFGHAYLKISRYLNYVASILIISALTIALLFGIKSILRKI
jgi:membrane-associated protein